MSEKEDFVEVKIPKAMADAIKELSWFKLYEDFEHFVKAAIRDKRETWRRIDERAERREAETEAEIDDRGCSSSSKKKTATLSLITERP